MRPFAIVVLCIFVVLALVGVFVFATYQSTKTQAIGKVVIWGSEPELVMSQFLAHIRDGRGDFSDVTYKEVAETELPQKLVEAIAAGKGPDLVIFPASQFYSQGDKLQAIPYSVVSRRTFQDSFVQGSEVFLATDGVKGLPFTIDPLVLYWNRSLFANVGLARPPRYWDEVAQMAPKLSRKTENGSLTQSAIALGSWDNVANAKGIVVTLMHQLGNEVISEDSKGKLIVDLTVVQQNGVSATESALRFFTDFADPVKSLYSWNRSQKYSRDAFIAGSLAMYIGPASDLTALRDANPNLNYDVAAVPAARGGGQEVFADIHALSLPRGAKNPNGAATAAFIMTSAVQETYLANELDLPSPRRDVEPDAAATAYRSTFRSSAINSFVFKDPDVTASDAIFARAIDAITSGRDTLSEAIRGAQAELQELARMR